MILAINYANEKFLKSQKFNSKSALRYGADAVREFGPQDMDRKFVQEHQTILQAERLGGYALWKPYIVREALRVVDENDYVVYSDAGSAFVNRIDYLIRAMEDQGAEFMVFCVKHPEKYYTKRDAFILMDCDKPTYTETPQILSGYFVCKKTADNFRFIEEWLQYGSDERIITNNDNVMGKDNYKGFVENRHDQTVLSLLSKKWQLPVFRDPSEYGYEEGYAEAVSDEILQRSRYPQIIESHRRPDLTNSRQLRYRSWYRILRYQVDYAGRLTRARLDFHRKDQ